MSGIRLLDCSKLAINWKETMTLQFFDMVSPSDFFDVFLFLSRSLVARQVSCQNHHWFWIYDKFHLQGIDQESGNLTYPRLSFAQYLETAAS